MVAQTRAELHYGDDVDSVDDSTDDDDFEFYRLQMQDECREAVRNNQRQSEQNFLPADEVDFSDEETSDDEGGNINGSNESEPNYDEESEEEIIEVKEVITVNETKLLQHIVSSLLSSGHTCLA